MMWWFETRKEMASWWWEWFQVFKTAQVWQPTVARCGVSKGFKEIKVLGI
jgi:hypothetical protein